MDKRLHLIIKGRVQGVFYRDSTRKKAVELGLKGYVKNLEDGSVELVAEGPEENLKMLLEWCWQGPDYAEVSDVKVDWTNSKENFKKFEIKY